MLYLWIFLMLLGFVLLVKGADWFVDGAAGIAGKCRVSPLIIGLTIVAFGTSAPELCVSITSAIQKSTDIAIGNVVGSNIINILLILGLSALFHALPVQRNSLVLDLPVLLLVSALLVGLGIWGNALNWWDGLIFLAVFGVYLFFLIRGAVKEQKSQEKTELPPPAEEKPKGKVGAWFDRMEQKTWFLILLTVVGLGMVVGGGTLLVDNAKAIAHEFNVPERIIGLTVIALGTSLPELVTSVVAAIKGETDIAVGNIIGSNIFNILLVAGVSSLFYPLAFTTAGATSNLIDACVALGAAAILYAFALFKGHKLGKIAGAFMLACFAGYYVYLFLV